MFTKISTTKPVNLLKGVFLERILPQKGKICCNMFVHKHGHV